MSDLASVHAFVGSKISWQRLVLQDRELSANARVLAAHLMHLMEKDTRSAWAKRQTMADTLGFSLKAVTRALAELRARNWIKSTPGGRGNANLISPILPRSDENETSPIGGHPRPAKQAENWTQLSQKVDVGVPPIKEQDNIPPYPPTLRRTRRAAPDAITIPAQPRPTFRNVELRDRLLKDFGEPFVLSYLDPAAWDPTAKQVVCSSSIGHSRLAEKAAKRLSEMGVRIVLDAILFKRLPRPLIAMDEAA